MKLIILKQPCIMIGFILFASNNHFFQTNVFNNVAVCFILLNICSSTWNVGALVIIFISSLFFSLMMIINQKYKRWRYQECHPIVEKLQFLSDG